MAINMFKSPKKPVPFIILCLIFIYIIFLIFNSVSIKGKLGKYPWTSESDYHEKERK